MTWTYNGNPSSSTLEAVRFLIGDTNTSDQQLQDEEISWLIDQNNDDAYAAAIACCRTLAAKYARLADVRFGDAAESASQKSKAYLELASSLSAQATLSVSPFAGGISVADKDAREADTDRVAPKFTIERFEHPDLNPATDEV